LGNDNDEQYDESNLVCEIDPIKFKNTIKLIYGLEYLTFGILKTIVKEGAKFNQILRINDESFDALTEALNIPCESEELFPSQPSFVSQRDWNDSPKKENDDLYFKPINESQVEEDNRTSSRMNAN